MSFDIIGPIGDMADEEKIVTLTTSEKDRTEVKKEEREIFSFSF